MRKLSIATYTLLLFLNSAAEAGWLSDALEGRFPPIADIGVCVIAPYLCVGYEGYKEQIRQKQVEREKNELATRLVEYRNALVNLLSRIQISSEKERAEIRAALDEGDACLLRVTRLAGADECNIIMRREVFRIHRKYQKLNS